MHEVAKGQGRPGGEEEGGHGGGDADGVKEGVQQPAGPQGVDGDEKDVDAAQVEGEVAVQEGAAHQQADHLEELVGHQQRGEDAPHPPAPGGGAPPVEQGAEDRRGQKCQQPGQVKGAEERKAHPLGDRLGGGEKVLHSGAAPCVGSGVPPPV